MILPLLHFWQISGRLLFVQSRDLGLLETLFGKSGQACCTSIGLGYFNLYISLFYKQ